MKPSVVVDGLNDSHPVNVQNHGILFGVKKNQTTKIGGELVSVKPITNP